jgi:hypothetical protein
MNINIPESIEFQKKYDTKEYLCYNNCIGILFDLESKEIIYVEGVYRAKYGWVDHAWLIMDNRIVDVTYTDWNEIVPAYYPCLNYSKKEVSELLMKTNGALPLFTANASLNSKYESKKESIFKK